MNAVAELLRQTLSVPNIYLEPTSFLIAADVLAVDRAGAGDLHAVEIKTLRKEFHLRTANAAAGNHQERVSPVDVHAGALPLPCGSHLHTWVYCVAIFLVLGYMRKMALEELGSSRLLRTAPIHLRLKWFFPRSASASIR